MTPLYQAWLSPYNLPGNRERQVRAWPARNRWHAKAREGGPGNPPPFYGTEEVRATGATHEAAIAALLEALPDAGIYLVAPLYPVNRTPDRFGGCWLRRGA